MSNVPRFDNHGVVKIRLLYVPREPLAGISHGAGLCDGNDGTIAARASLQPTAITS